jgi:transcription elongation factor GreB
MKNAKVVEPAAQPDKGRVFFGATVAIADEADNQRNVTIVGNDEADAGAGRIGWDSPLARALRGAGIGDLRRVSLPGGEKEWEVIAIHYPTPA